MRYVPKTTKMTMYGLCYYSQFCMSVHDEDESPKEAEEEGVVVGRHDHIPRQCKQLAPEGRGGK